MKARSMPLVTIALFWSASVFAGMDDASLKERLAEYYFYASHDSIWREFDAFKKQNDVSDRQLHRVLMAIYREAVDNRPALTPQSDEWRRNQGMAESVVRWLPKCGDVPVKEFLMDRMAAEEPDGHIRQQAVLAYLRVADAEEAKNILLRFLVGGNRTDLERLSVYGFASAAYDESNSPGKKSAILAALTVAADKEEGKIRFMKVDGILAERSAAYRRSRERLVMLERHNLEPPTINLYTDRDLKVALAESRKYKRHTSINTNLAVFEEHKFNLPQTNFRTNGVPALVPIGTNNEPEPSAPPPSQFLRLAVPLVVGAGLLAAFALWRGLRKRM